MKNKIEREIEIKASKEKVFDAISNPEKVVKWFPEALEGSYKVGEQPIFGFGEYGRSQVLIVASNPYDYFSYRWVPGANHYLGDVNKVQTTLVEFKIEEIDDNSCKVILVESGFENLAEELRDKAFEQNLGGWDFMLGRLKKYFN